MNRLLVQDNRAWHATKPDSLILYNFFFEPSRWKRSFTPVSDKNDFSSACNIHFGATIEQPGSGEWAMADSDARISSMSGLRACLQELSNPNQFFLINTPFAHTHHIPCRRFRRFGFDCINRLPHAASFNAVSHILCMDCCLRSGLFKQVRHKK